MDVSNNGCEDNDQEETAETPEVEFERQLSTALQVSTRYICMVESEVRIIYKKCFSLSILWQVNVLENNSRWSGKRYSTISIKTHEYNEHMDELNVHINENNEK